MLILVALLIAHYHPLEELIELVCIRHLLISRPHYSVGVIS